MSYLTTVLADNPVHFWRLADPGGHFLNDIGSSFYGLFGAGYLGELGYTGPNSDGGSAMFTNAARFWNVDPVSITPPVTIEAIFWLAQQDAKAQTIFDTELTGQAVAGLGLELDSTGHPFLSNSSSALTSGATVSKQAWHHVAAVHSGAVRTLLVDGAQVASAAQALGVYTGSFSIGARSRDAGQPSEMFISECAFYLTALSNARVAAHFAAIDQLGNRPVFKASGSFNASTGASTFNTDDIASILAAVRHTFPTT